MPAKKSQNAFTSMRVIGKKAQRLLQRAKNSDQSSSKKSVRRPSPAKRHDEVVMHISVQSVIRAAFGILAIAAGTILVYHLRDKILLLLLAAFIAAVIDPSVDQMERRGFPRGIAILVHYFFAIFILLFLLLSFIPIIAEQIQGIAIIISAEVDAFLSNPKIDLPLVKDDVNVRLTGLVNSTLQNLNINQFTDALAQFGQSLSSAAQGGVRFATRVAGNVVNFFISMLIVLVLAFFMQIEKEGIIRWFRSFFPVDYRVYLDNKFEAMHSKIGQWARGELLLMLTIFSLTLVALLILRMPYALTLAVLAGICEFIPAIGPFIAAVPAVLIAFTQGGFVMGLVTMGVYYIIQWCENNLLVPLIMKRAVGLSPIAILFAMLVGVSFPDTVHPVLGIMLAVPTTTLITIFLEDWRIGGKK
ncbi:MAG: AI-2E family transporter [Candidatus Peribacteraceae bacterium]|nr:AI-2E family transporter [Candidatus Peribacteraceae bacterium]|tara:strand:+ start:5655 stop:6902 length:1248 start_codon:yes stop_codon:yes gene_type:complete